MFRTARPWKGAGALALGGLLLIGSAVRADDPPSLPKQLVGLGRQALDQGRPTEAAAFFKKALQLDPSNTEAHRALGDRALTRVAMQLGGMSAAPPSDTPAGPALPAPVAEPAPAVESVPPAPAAATPAAVPPLSEPAAGENAAVAGPPNATLERASELQGVLAQQLQADIRGRMTRARELLNRQQPQEAITTLRLARAAIEANTDVPENVRNALLREVEAEIRSAVRQEERIEAQQLERLRLQQAATQRAGTSPTNRATRKPSMP